MKRNRPQSRGGLHPFSLFGVVLNFDNPNPVFGLKVVNKELAQFLQPCASVQSKDW